MLIYTFPVAHFRRGQGRRTTDEENLCAVSGVCVQGDAFARDPEARPASAPEEEIAELCESRSSPQDDTNGQDDEVPEPVVSVTIEQNTDYENQKSISRKTKAIPPPASPLGDGSWRLDGMSNFRNVFSDAAIGGRTSSGEEHGAHFDEESLSDGNPTEETSEMNPDPALDADDQDCLAELGTPPEQSAFDEDAAYSEASTVLIRGRAQTARSWPSDVGRSLPLRRDPQRQQLGEIPEEDVQNPVIGRRDCVIELRSKDDDADGSRNRHPRNGQTTSYRECRDGSAGRSDDHLLRTSANGSPNVGTVNIIKAGGNGGHLMVNNGGISIQVFNCLPRDGEGLGNKASSGDLLIDDPSVPSSFTCDSEETHVKRPVYGPLPAFATGCRPRNERSIPSFTHFPVQETCDGPPLSASSFK